MWTGIAIAGSALASAYIGSEASASAADAQKQSTDKAIGASTAATDAARRDLAPYATGGASALQRLMYLTGVGGGVDQNDPRYKSIYDSLVSNADAAHQKQFGMSIFAPNSGLNAPGERSRFEQQMNQQASQKYQTQYGNEAKNDPNYGALSKPFSYSLADFYKDPSYDFQLKQGEQGIERAMSARGLSSSTPGLKALMQWNQDYAGTAYSGAFNRAFGVDQSNKQTQYNFLSGIAGLGENAAAQSGNTGVAGAGTVANASIAGGQAAASGIIGSAQSQNAALQGGLGNYMYNQRYQQTMGLYGNLMNMQQPTSNFDYTGTTAAGGRQYG